MCSCTFGGSLFVAGFTFTTRPHLMPLAKAPDTIPAMLRTVLADSGRDSFVLRVWPPLSGNRVHSLLRCSGLTNGVLIRGSLGSQLLGGALLQELFEQHCEISFRYTGRVCRYSPAVDRSLINLRVEGFNVFSRTQWGTGSESLQSPTLGQLQSSADLLNTPRQMQVALKLYF